jgi:hypothetical protein
VEDLSLGGLLGQSLEGRADELFAHVLSGEASLWAPGCLVWFLANPMPPRLYGVRFSPSRSRRRKGT